MVRAPNSVGFCCGLLGFYCGLLFFGAACGQTSHVTAGGGGETAAGATGGEPSLGGAGGASNAGGSTAGTGGSNAGASGGPTCDPVVFEDAAVEQAVRKKLGLAEGEPLDGMRMSELRGTLYLEAATSLAGLECSSGLGGLDVTGGKLTELAAVGQLPALKTLSLRQTELAASALDGVSRAPALREVYLFDIQLDDLVPLAQLPSLRVLLIGAAGITDLSPLASTELESLFLDDNQLSDLTPLAELSTLRSLSIARTEVTSIEPLAQLQLQELNITGSPVVSLAALGAPAMPEECSHLRAEDLPLSEESWTTDRDRLCALGWAVRASRPGDAAATTCGDWCDIQ